MRSLRWISIGLALCVFVPCWAGAEEWIPLGKGMRWGYRVATINQTVIAGMQHTQRERGTRDVEVRDVSASLPESPYEVVETRAIRTDGQQSVNRTTSRSWLRTDERGVLVFGEEFPNPFAVGKREFVRYEPPLRYLPADPRPGTSWHVGVERAMGLRIDLTGTVIGTRDARSAVGLHRGCLEVRYTGQISGHFESPDGPLSVVSGSVMVTSYYAPGLGSVLEKEYQEMRLRMPDGQIVAASARTEMVLETSSLLPSAPASMPPPAR